MRGGKSGVVTGFMNKVQTAVQPASSPTPCSPQMHRRMAEPDR